MREKTYPHTPTMFFFSQKNTEEQNTQHSTETLSQPISQNLTATFSWNALWYLYAGGLLWVRNSVLMSSVKSVSSVREKPPQWVSQLFFFSQRNTEEQNTQGFTETLSQPISQNLTANRGLTPNPSPNGEGSDYRGYPYMSSKCLAAYLLLSAGQKE